MRADEMDLRELLDLGGGGGVLRFAGQRALLLDAVALGVLRRELIETIGLTAARGVLTRFGYAHGWRTAESLKTALPWDSEREWRLAGARLHMLQGLVRVDTIIPDAAQKPRLFAEALWHDSYEAEQHLLHLGQSDAPVCWTLTGFASGYLSFCNGREIYCVEDRCRGRGDAACHVMGRPLEEWNGAIDAELPFYRQGCLNEALARLTRSLKQAESRLRRTRRRLGDDDARPRSDAMQRLLDLASRAAKVDATVLVTGESGSGKERVARLVHEQSARAAGPFLAVNCAAVSESLLESELFGHVRGAFTGASADRAGLFEAASGGTLLLDEVGEVPLHVQAKLLRVLQEREVRRVGENTSRRTDVRVVAATNRDLAEEVAARRFRRDLFYRLKVIELRVPALRERPEDILPLARTFLAAAAARAGRRVTGLAPEAAGRLVRHAWPGNVRELENAMERAVALCEGPRVEERDLPDEVRAGPSPFAPGSVRRLEEVERDCILAALEANGGHQARTAAALGIGTATLYRKLRRYRAKK